MSILDSEIFPELVKHVYAHMDAQRNNETVYLNVQALTKEDIIKGGRALCTPLGLTHEDMQEKEDALGAGGNFSYEDGDFYPDGLPHGRLRKAMSQHNFTHRGIRTPLFEGLEKYFLSFEDGTWENRKNVSVTMPMVAKHVCDLLNAIRLGAFQGYKERLVAEEKQEIGKSNGIEIKDIVLPESLVNEITATAHKRADQYMNTALNIFNFSLEDEELSVKELIVKHLGRHFDEAVAKRAEDPQRLFEFYRCMGSSERAM